MTKELLSNNDDLSNFLEQHTAGEKITVTVLRKGKEVVIPYVLKPLNK
ncbi:MAG: serine protease [Fibrobacter sp.]|nr:serine protease [Fibrobacter sp.]